MERGVRYVGNRTIADRLRRFTGRIWNRDKVKDSDTLTQEQFQALVVAVKDVEKELYDLVGLILKYSVRGEKESYQLAMRLLRILVSDEPLQQFLHFPLPSFVLKLVRRLSLWHEQKARHCLQVLCPFIYELFVHFGVNSMPYEIVAVLKEAARRALQIQQLAEARRGMPVKLEEGDESGGSDREGNRYKTTGCFYGMDAKRARPPYSRDTVGRETGTDASACSKSFPAYKEITGGAMILWCRHRIALGFHIIPKSEGRNDVFSAMLTHWSEAPRVVCYDFACDLMQYSTAREPLYFKKTLFLVDRLHMKNHTACSECFAMKSFHESGAKEYFNFNDSAAETGNALLKKIRTSCLFMSPGRFMDYVRLFLEVQNRRRLHILTMQQHKHIHHIHEQTETSFGFDHMIDYIEQLH
ncbi:MAG: hypothetical protein JWL77_6795 [Chthonomonadaceae bacterium]|nr:hypothetical protein [Chthonomonadaceae bacterium]